MTEKIDEKPADDVVAIQEDTKYTSRVGWAIFMYAACSSTLLIVNKLAVHSIPSPCFVLVCQFLATALFVKLLANYSKANVELMPLEYTLARRFSGGVAPLWVTRSSFAP
ncbi:hypothetical protein FOZ63_014800, partial [Perkinsus olseni]